MNVFWRAGIAFLLLISLSLGFRAFWIACEMVLLWPHATWRDELTQFGLAILWWLPAILIGWRFSQSHQTGGAS